ncbi:hypothetical protein [Litoribrevibacter albus]|uniref:Lipase helper protein n=1 Tax=Litoribrevibacter albus TaxID=1473156 RepID=A0AA37S8J5_9GAMM|nr:hypothetical protein [Litoribrevibacter albus]GLQ30354.1 hypothetical protein GCM10007876_08320 [Litoribrevibacter albus]
MGKKLIVKGILTLVVLVCLAMIPIINQLQSLGWMDTEFSRQVGSQESSSNSTEVSELASGLSSQTSPNLSSSRSSNESATPGHLGEYDAFKQQMIHELKQRYGGSISDVALQATLRDFRDYVAERFPDAGDSLFREIITAAFPEQARKIFALVAKLDEYYQWHLDQLVALNEMDPLTREGTVWQKRTDLFGTDAELIWAEELNRTQQKEAKVQETLASLNQADQVTMDERLYILTSTIEEEYQSTLASGLMDKSMMAGVFFGLDSVQNDLKTMSPEERQEEINRVRKQLGFTDEQIERLSSMDQKNEARWQTGYKYSAARKALESQYTGAELESKLQALREEMFEREAKTIAMEEASGFYRFDRPRVFGRN